MAMRVWSWKIYRASLYHYLFLILHFRQTTSFYNAAYVREDTPVNDPPSIDEGSSIDDTLDTVDEQCPKWAVEYDNARKRYERSSRAVPTGRLFDIQNPGGSESKIWDELRWNFIYPGSYFTILESFLVFSNKMTFIEVEPPVELRISLFHSSVIRRKNVTHDQR